MIFQSIMMITQVFCGFLSLAFLGVKKLDSLARSSIWYSSFSSQIPSYKGGIFYRFFSFLARNGLEFLVSREKSKCEKNATHSCDCEDRPEMHIGGTLQLILFFAKGLHSTSNLIYVTSIRRN